MKKYSLLLLLPFLSGCPIKLPPITFTQTQTAAERQLIGENREIEKDAWLVSSIQTSASGPEVWKRAFATDSSGEKNGKKYNNALQVLAYLHPEYRELMSRGILAEGLDGMVHWNPRANESIYVKLYNSAEEKARIGRMISLLNQNRSIITGHLIENSSNKTPSSKRQLELQFYESAEEGDYIETSKGKWEIKG